MSIEVTSSVGLRPADWPASGHIDLAVHDLPHASSTMEWWYVNSHVTVADGRTFALFAAFFRVDVSDEGAPERSHAHFLTWALTDAAGGRFHAHTLLDPRSPGMALHDLEHGFGPGDDRLTRALREVFSKGRVPLPDRMLTRDARVNLSRLDLDYDGNCFRKRDDGSYELVVAAHDGAEGGRLRFTLEKPVVRHGDDGVVRGSGGEDMFYYFSPRCRVEGVLRVDGVDLDVVDGAGWYDHEFGDRTDGSGGDAYAAESKVAWNWLAAQLDDGTDISAYDLFDREDPSRSHGRWVIVVAPSGERRAYTDFSLEPLDPWTSTRSFNEYPTRYRLEVPAARLYLDVKAVIPGQEILTVISAPGFWEGAVTVRGILGDVEVAGRGFVERSGLSVVGTTDDFFASVGRETRRAIDALLPEHLDAEHALALIGGARRRHFLDGVDLEQYSRTVLQPIREIILRGGKAWRSYGVLACMDLVGGDSQRFAHWLALPELLHVGSLIIDDVQDGSDVRRGGPSCHKLYGDALAINAGCVSYFLAQIPVGESGLSDGMRATIYEAYFEALRAAHAGQALDIDSLGRMIPEVVETGDAALLERRVLAIHRLKSAAPAGGLARIAARIGGGSDAQAEGLGNLFESFGVAFQIIDDVLNLRGFEQDRKSRGEDITAGKITAPVAKAMGRLSRDDRRTLAAILASKPADKAIIRQAVAVIDGCGALDACEREARDLVESAWTQVDPLIPDSQFKVRLRAFGWFVLDRHY
jgi:geranylgeranyl pyrophosphate synthase/predicted secreted hydrolase